MLAGSEREKKIRGEEWRKTSLHQRKMKSQAINAKRKRDKRFSFRRLAWLKSNAWIVLFQPSSLES